MELEAELDRLYQTSASDFVAARNQLARALRQAGQRIEAERITKLVRPSPVAWLVNQLFFRERDALDALIESGAELKRAQEALADPEDFSRRKRAHQQALRVATELAVSIADKAKMAVNAGLKRRIELTLVGLDGSAEGEVPPPGRMSAEPEPRGFDAFAGSNLPDKAAVTSASDEALRQKALGEARTAILAIEQEVHGLEEQSRLAHERLEIAAVAATEAERIADTARKARDLARRDAEAAKTKLDEVRGELTRQKRALASTL